MLDVTNNSRIEFIHADHSNDVVSCFELMKQLRPKLENAEVFLEKVLRMQKNGYRLLVAYENSTPVGLAGYRLDEMLVHGKYIYVDDLVTSEGKRGQGLGEQLLNKVFELAKKQKCNKVILDTGIGNSFAQRFYFRMGMLPVALHFSYELGC